MVSVCYEPFWGFADRSCAIMVDRNPERFPSVSICGLLVCADAAKVGDSEFVLVCEDFRGSLLRDDPLEIASGDGGVGRCGGGDLKRFWRNFIERTCRGRASTRL